MKDFFRGKIPALAACGMFALAIILYRLGQGPAYQFLGSLFGFNLWRFAFLDTDTVLSAVRCFNMGIDAYATNPCDDLERVYTYSPLWLGLTAFPVTQAWIAPMGLVIACAFLAVLFLFPAPRNRLATLGLTLAVVSSASAFALERGNNDLVLFTLVALTAVFLTKSPRVRAIGYGLAFLAGLLKYYPMAVMAVAARETPKRLLAVVALSIAVLILVVSSVWTELPKAFANIPVGSYVGDMFGSITVAGMISSVAGRDGWLLSVVHLGMSLVAFGIGARLAFDPTTGVALARLTEREAAFLQVGALIVLGCFFTAQNIGYRAVHLILCVPALLALAAIAPQRRFRWGPTAAILLLWAMTWRQGAVALGQDLGGETGGQLGHLLGWAVRESLWWFVVTLLLSFVIALLADAPIVRQFLPARLLPPRVAPLALPTSNAED